MSKEVENIIPFTKKAEPVEFPKDAQAIPHYVAVEEEEETITLDFDNKKAYSTTEESWILRDSETKEVIASGSTAPAFQESLANIPPIVEKPEDKPVITFTDGSSFVSAPVPGLEFKNELQDIFFNTLVSKAIASLLSKHRQLETELDDRITLFSGSMGELSALIEDGVDHVLDQRRKELKACYNGVQVRYEMIPDWAKSYVRDYVKEKVTEVALLTAKGF